MADKDKRQGVPAVTAKSKKLEQLQKGQKPDTGGDPLDRYSGQYAKNPPKRDDDPFLDIY